MGSKVNLAGRVALVTGASRGIGRAIALELAQQGAQVAVNYLAQEGAAAEVVAAIQGAGGEALAVQADVGESSAVEEMTRAVLDRWGRVDILVNNAGVTRDTLLMRMSDDVWNSVIRTHLTGTFFCTRAVLRSMVRQRWGRIITISSIVGVHGNAGQANYAAAKAGLIGFTKSVAKEVASRHITVNALAPGWIETDMVATVAEPIRKEVAARIPLGRLGTPADVAGVVAFLASDAASYITGQVIGIDGGMVL